MITASTATTTAGIDTESVPTVGSQADRSNRSVPLVDATPARFHGPMIR